jgi:Tol biopolymer transport system component
MESSGQKRRKFADGCYPSWSPDGKTLFYHSHKEKKLKAAPVGAQDGAAAQDLLDVPWCYPAVSPDGSQVAYRDKNDLIILQRQTTKRMTTWPLGKGLGLLPAWSPDGTRLAFGVHGRHENSGLLMLDLASGRVVEVARSPALMPAWSRDGARLAFDVRLPSGSEIWMIETKDLQGLKPLGRPGEQR